MSTGTQTEVVMPQMGVSVSEGTITKWLKSEGEHIGRDEPLLEISTDKVDTEVPSPGEGVVAQILVQEGETVEVGTVLAVIAPEGAAPAERRRSRGAARAGHPGRRRRLRGRRDRDARRPRSPPQLLRPLPLRPPRRSPATAAPSSRPSSPGSPPSTASIRTRSRAPAPAAA